MKKKTVRCRKPHPCDLCEEDIKHGEFAFYSEGRSAYYATGYEQTGITYWKSYIHADHDSQQDCPECNHRTGWNASYAHGGSEYYECKHCGHKASYP